MIKPLLVSIVAVGLFACSRSSTRPPYTEEDVRAFVQPGTSREAIIKRFGEPQSDEKNPKFEGDYTGVDEIIYYFLATEHLQRPSKEEWAFAGFQVRLKDAKAVDWSSTHAD
jgi:hypothetical protein